MKVEKDIVQVLIDEYRDRIQPSIPSEVQDIANDHGLSAVEVCEAMNIALDEIEAKRS